MRKGFVALAVSALFAATAACGGDEAAPPPAAPLAPPPVADGTPSTATAAAAPAQAKPTMAEMQAAAAKAAADAINARDAKKFAMGFAEDGVWNQAGVGEFKGRAEIEQAMQQWLDAFKDTKFAFSRAWTKGDVAAYEWAWTGTNTGEFMGQKPTEKPAGVMGVSVVSFGPDGLVKRNNHYTDAVTVNAQLTGKGKARPIPALPANMETFAAKGTPEEDKNVEPWKAMFAALENKKEADFLAALSDDIEWNDMTQPAPGKGKADAKKAYQMLVKAFPDMKATPTMAMGVGDVGIVEYTLTGTQKGPLAGIPAKNKPVTIHGVHIVHVKDGKVDKGWDYANNVEMLTQLGVLKAPAAAKPAEKKEAAPAAGEKKAAATPKAPAEKK